MGTWGIDIPQNDTFCEVQEDFRKSYFSGETEDSIEQRIKQAYKESPVYHIVVFALADSLWHIGKIDSRHLVEVQSIIEQKTDLSFWMDSGAQEAQIRLREKKLNQFYAHLKRAPSSGQLWRAPHLCRCLQKGEVFWYKSLNRIYGAVVLDYHPEPEEYLIAISDELSHIPLSQEQVLSASVYTAAWFASAELLPMRQIHSLAFVEISMDYNGYAGMLSSERGVYVSNVGQRATWKHTFRCLGLPSCQMKELIEGKRLTKTYPQNFC